MSKNVRALAFFPLYLNSFETFVLLSLIKTLVWSACSCRPSHSEDRQTLLVDGAELRDDRCEVVRL